MNEIFRIAELVALIDSSKGPLSDLWSDAPAESPSAPLHEFPFGIWFRGHADAGWELTPGVFRGATDAPPYVYDETSMYHHFQLISPEHRQHHQSAFDWLCLMQHYGMPTRLLDWTESPIIALLFAVEKEHHDGVDGKLFALNARRLNAATCVSTKESICVANSLDTLLRATMAYSRIWDRWEERVHRSDTFDPVSLQVLLGSRPRDEKRLAMPVAVLPPRLNPRMTPQRAAFTVHGGKRYAESVRGGPEARDCLPEPVAIDKLVTRDPFLAEFIVPASAKRDLRRQLRRLGIHSGAVYPELEHQAQFLVGEWRRHY